MVTDEARQRGRLRAGNRCEYCLSQQDYVMGRLQVDHINPQARGGTDDDDNLCLACELCNQYKWKRFEGIDPQTGLLTTLFNPHQQSWDDHFVWSEDGSEILGLTPCGRATVAVLQMNNSLVVTVRKNWVRAGWHPPSI